VELPDAFIRLVRDEGYQLAEVGAQAGRSEAYVSKRMRVFEDSKLRSAIEGEQLAVSVAEEFLTVPTERRGELVVQAIEEHWDVPTVRTALRAGRGNPDVLTPSESVGREGSTTHAGRSTVADPGVIEGSFREVDALFANERVEAERSPTRGTDTNPARGQELVRQLKSMRDVIRDLRPYELTDAEERALAELFQALLRLARARQQSAQGPVFPALEQAARLARRR
jgi:hypothetical protein